MTIFEADVNFDNPQFEYMTIEAADKDEAEYEMQEALRIDFPDAKNITVENIKELKNR